MAQWTEATTEQVNKLAASVKAGTAQLKVVAVELETEIEGEFELTFFVGSTALSGFDIVWYPLTENLPFAKGLAPTMNEQLLNDELELDPAEWMARPKVVKRRAMR